MADIGESAWERVATEASEQFLRWGYRGVSLSKIASALGMKAGSLYYHCPEGKAELYVRSLEFAFERMRATLDAVGHSAFFPESVQAMAVWTVTHAPIDLRRIIEIDLPEVSQSAPALADRMQGLLHAGLFEPYLEVFQQAKTQGLLAADAEPEIAAAAVVALADGLGISHGRQEGTEHALVLKLVRDAIHLLLRGVCRSPP